MPHNLLIVTGHWQAQQALTSPEKDDLKKTKSQLNPDPEKNFAQNNQRSKFWQV